MYPHGRRKIYVFADSITRDNIVDVLTQAMTVHSLNRVEIIYLHNYYKGLQPIRFRVKKYNNDILNKIVENHAYETTEFKVGYQMGDDGIKYVSYGESADRHEDLVVLNRWEETLNRDADDMDLFTWMFNTGVAYRMCLPNKQFDGRNGVPFRNIVPKPQNTFVAYYTDVDETPAMGVTFVRQVSLTGAEMCIYTVYTPDTVYTLQGNAAGLGFELMKSEPNTLGMIPIIEYVTDTSRLGCFEPGLYLLDGINNLASNRVDGIEQMVQSMMLFHNVEIDEETYLKVKDLGALVYQDRSSDMKGDVSFVNNELNQDGAQTLTDHLYEQYLRIVGLPSQAGETRSTSDTGTAVIYRAGWAQVEARARKIEKSFLRSEKQYLAIVLKICSQYLKLRIEDIDVSFTRRQYDNPQSKAQTLTTLLASIPPHQAYVYSGMFTDPEAEYREYDEWKKLQEAKEAEMAAMNNGGSDAEDSADAGSDPED